jgi:hypothetical protein
MLVSEGDGPFPVRKFAAFLDDQLREIGQASTDLEVTRSLASALLITAYAVAPWDRAGNHLGVAEGWIATSLKTLHIASGLESSHDRSWRLAFELCRDTVRERLQALLLEAAALDDLVVPDLAEGLVYGTRALLVLGYCSGFFLAERELGNVEHLAEPLLRLIKREIPYLRTAGEAAAPALFLTSNVLEVLGDPLTAGAVMTRWGLELSIANGRRPEESSGAVADLYHTLEECLLRDLGAEAQQSLERFDGRSYTSHIVVEWLARREYRAALAQLWPLVSRLTLCEFRPMNPADILTLVTPDGALMNWVPPLTASWDTIRRDATTEVVGRIETGYAASISGTARGEWVCRSGSVSK